MMLLEAATQYETKTIFKTGIRYFEISIEKIDATSNTHHDSTSGDFRDDARGRNAVPETKTFSF